VPPALGPAPELHLPAQRHFALANGLRVRLVEHHRLPIVALHLVVDAGAARDPGRLQGLASFTASMLTEGTRTRSATRISDEVGFLGASLAAGAGSDAAYLSGSSLAGHLPALLEIFADVAMNPAFRRDDFDRVQDQRRVALLQQRDQPPVVAANAFTMTFWGAHPYGHPVIGTEAALEATRRSDLVGFHDRYWRAANAELVVVGGVTETELRPMLERTLGSWRAGVRAPPLRTGPPAAPHRTVLVDKPDAPQAFVLLGMPGLDRSSPDFVAARVMFEVLGGGTSSRLFRKLREEKGYTYGMGASADARRSGGASVLRGSVKADVTGAALRELLGEIERLRREEVPAPELEDAKNGIVRSLPAEFATVGEIAGRVAELLVYGLPDDYWNRFADEVRAVTAADVLRAAERYLDPSRTTLVLVGAPAVVEPQLAGLPLGKVEVRPPPGSVTPRSSSIRRNSAERSPSPNANPKPVLRLP
jgi:predicted Zn-dependent peptidase